VAAALGTTVTIPTLSSQARLEVPPGTQPGTLLRLPGQGLPGLKGKPRGDLVVEVALETPTNLSPQQKKLLRELLKLQEQSAPNRLEERIEKKGR
jgi:molecular chaperone DnaJ